MDIMTHDTNQHRVGPNYNTKKRSSERQRVWSFTLNNHTEEDLTQWHNNILKYKIIKFRIQEEIGEECKTPHIHGIIYFTNAIRFNTVIKLFGHNKAQWKYLKTKLDIIKWDKYCRKKKTATGKIWEKIAEATPKTVKLTPEEINELLKKRAIEEDDSDYSEYDLDLEYKTDANESISVCNSHSVTWK